MKGGWKRGKGKGGGHWLETSKKWFRRMRVEEQDEMGRGREVGMKGGWRRVDEEEEEEKKDKSSNRV